MTSLRIGVVTALVIIATGCRSWTPPPLPANAIPPVIAVSSFDNKSGFEGKWELGTGMAELLLGEISRSENFVAVERIALDRVVGEIDRQGSDYFRDEGKIARGRLKNAEYLVRGTITDFSQVSGGSLWLWLRGVFLGGRTSTARVALSLTIVEVESGEIVGSVQSTGDAPAYAGYVAADYAGVSFGGDAFFDTPLGSATRDAMRQALYELAVNMPRTYWRPQIAAVRDGQVIISGGRNRGVRIGTVFQVREPTESVTDPQTGDVIHELAGRIVGRVRVVRVLDKAAIADPISGSGFEREQWLEHAAVDTLQ